MKTAMLASGLSLMLSGCSSTGSTYDSYTGPSGEKINTVRCKRTTTGCFKKSSKACEGGSYRVVSSHRNAGGALADIFPGPVTWYTMSIVCGQPDGRMPSFPWRGVEPFMPELPKIVAPTPQVNQPVRTDCNRIGDRVTCTTY